MVFKGYLAWGGTELANAARTARYIDVNAPAIPLRDRWDCGDLRTALDEPEYESPMVDDAPWYDPSDPSTARFFGLYPLDFEGFDDGTRTAPMAELITDGGVIGQERASSRSVRVRGALIAADDLALQSGMTWLKQALNQSDCTQHGASCGGADLAFYTACPQVCRTYEESWGAGRDFSLYGGITPETSPTLYPESAANDAMLKALIELDDRDGLIVTWGAVDASDTSSRVEEHGPVMLQRTNYLLDPRFVLHTSPYWATTGGTQTPHATGGPDNDPYLTVTPSGTGVLRSANMVANSGETIASFDLRSSVSGAVTLRMIAVTGDVVIASAVANLSTGWQRFSFNSTYGGPVYITATSTTVFEIAHGAVEAGHTPLPFFDGNTDPSQFLLTYRAGWTDPEYSVAWQGAANITPSRGVWNGQMTVGIPYPDQTPNADTYANATEGICDAYPFIDVQQGTATGTVHVTARQAVTVEEQMLAYERTFHGVGRIDDVKFISESIVPGGIIRVVDFVLGSENPFAFSRTESIVDSTVMTSLPTQHWADPDCTVVAPAPILDPDCAVPPLPPRPPIITEACIDDETTWERYVLDLPSTRISAWSNMIPTVGISSGVNEIRQVRARIFPNPFDYSTDVTIVRRNRATNPALWNDATSWATTAGVFSRPAGAPNGGFWARATASAAHAVQSFGPISAATGANTVTPGKYVNLSVWGRASTARQVQLRYAFLDAAGSVIGSVAYASTTTVVAGVATRFYVTGILVPALAVRVSIGLVNGSTVATTGETIDATMADIQMSDTVAVLDSYVDGYSAPRNGVYFTWDAVDGGSSTTGTKIQLDPCSWCAEFILSYLPANTTISVDAITRTAYASVNGGPIQPASQLLYGSDGGPMTWPELSCGIPYILTIDVPQPLLDDVTISVDLTKREG